MKNKFVLFLSVSFGLLCSNKVAAQDNFGIKIFGLSIHPKGEKANAHLMPNRLDPDGYLVMNIGAMFSYEKFVFKDIVSLKTVQALYSDCAAQPGGFSHIGVRAQIVRTGKHSFYGGIGPTIVYRKNWLRLDGYVNPHRFKGGPNDRWQYLFLWHGGEFEYKYAVSERFDFSATFVPGYPDLMSLSIGIHLKLNK